MIGGFFAASSKTGEFLQHNSTSTRFGMGRVTS